MPTITIDGSKIILPDGTSLSSGNNFLNPQQPFPLRQQVASQRSLNTVYTNGNRRRLVLVTLLLQTPASSDLASAYFQAPANDAGTQSYVKIQGVAGLNLYIPIWGVVNPGETYWVLTQISGTGFVGLRYWLEVDL